MINRLSIQGKLLLTTSILLIAGSLLSLRMNHSALTDIATRQFMQKMELAANALGEQMGGAVRFNKKDLVDSSYRALRSRYPEVLSAIAVKNIKGDIVLQNGRENRYDKILTQLMSELPPASDATTSRHDIDGSVYFVTQTPILFSDKRQNVGTLILLADFSQLSGEVTQISRNLLLVWLGILITIIVLVQIASSIVLQTPLTRLHDLVQHLNDGKADLGSRIEINASREISSIATEFNRFISTIQSLVAQLIEQTQVLTELKRKGAHVSSNLNRVAAVQNEKISTTGTQVGTLADVTGRVRQLTEQSSRQIDAVTDITRESISTITDVRDQILSLEQSIQDSSRAINDLSEKSQTIGSVLDVIRGIAEQTNLLALNAAIEAARAGEQGRGFAVVADEVRSLAGKTQQSTEEIQAMIGGLQAGSQRAVAQMQTSSNDVRDSVQNIVRASGVIASASTQIADLRAANNEIDQITRTQLSLSEQLTQLLQVVMENAAEVSQEVRENQQITQRIESEISRSESIIAQFRQ